MALRFRRTILDLFQERNEMREKQMYNELLNQIRYSRTGLVLLPTLSSTLFGSLCIDGEIWYVAKLVKQKIK